MIDKKKPTNKVKVEAQAVVNDKTNKNIKNKKKNLGESMAKKKGKKPDKQILAISIVAICLGVLTGFGINKIKGPGSGGSGPGGRGNSNIEQVAGDKVKAGDTFGVDDPDTFDTNAIGYIQKAEIADEGTHRLVRPGGVSQTVNLISSVTDLDKFEGMEIKVYGETFKSQKGGWFMDVGRVEVINPEAEAPLDG